MFKLAELFVKISAEDSALQKQLGGVRQSLAMVGAIAKGLNPFAGWEKETAKAAKGVTGLGVVFANLASGAIASASSALAGFISRGVSGAADLGETMSKLNDVLGDSASAVLKVADHFEKFGMSRNTILSAASDIALIAKGAGQSQEAAARMGAEMTETAVGVMSKYNIDLPAALAKIKSGLTGESVPLRDLGVLMNEDAVAAEALRLGLVRTTKELDDQVKVMARASLISAGLAHAHGDLEKTAGSTKNQWRIFTGTLENASVTIGQALQPAIDSVLGQLTGFARGIAQSLDSAKPYITGFVDFVASWADGVAMTVRGLSARIAEGMAMMRPAIQPALDVFTVVGDAIGSFVDDYMYAWRNLPKLIDVAVLEITQDVINIGEIFAVVPTNLARIGDYIAGNWRELIVDAVSAVGAAFANLGTNLANLGSAIVAFLSDPTRGFNFDWKPLLDGFKATAGQLPEMMAPVLTDMQGAIDAKLGEIAKDEADRTARLKAGIAARSGAMAQTANSVAAATAKKTAEFKSETSGVSEFALKLREGIFGQDKNEIPRQQLAEQKKSTEYAKKIAESLAKGLVARMS